MRTILASRRQPTASRLAIGNVLMSRNVDDDRVTIALTKAVALVVFHWLHQLEDDDEDASADLAVQVALENLSALLERALVEPFQTDYGDIIAGARARLLREAEGD